ncbi:hypothetical protein KIN20_028091 [Parelaphostrongylus tenuis]|uniref:Uncharacterized protein n=1 Tax=Parelaphostrongylus tenuis TaxID=148309 RepID=A0AAD5R0I2_PARTN|nr:hypothetical protein KIN20_028091 [Parelaphostrongylus tenuis]
MSQIIMVTKSIVMLFSPQQLNVYPPYPDTPKLGAELCALVTLGGTEGDQDSAERCHTAIALKNMFSISKRFECDGWEDRK